MSSLREMHGGHASSSFLESISFCIFVLYVFECLLWLQCVTICNVALLMLHLLFGCPDRVGNVGIFLSFLGLHSIPDNLLFWCDGLSELSVRSKESFCLLFILGCHKFGVDQNLKWFMGG